MKMHNTVLDKLSRQLPPYNFSISCTYSLLGIVIFIIGYKEAFSFDADFMNEHLMIIGFFLSLLSLINYFIGVGTVLSYQCQQDILQVPWCLIAKNKLEEKIRSRGKKLRVKDLEAILRLQENYTTVSNFYFNNNDKKLIEIEQKNDIITLL